LIVFLVPFDGNPGKDRSKLAETCTASMHFMYDPYTEKMYADEVVGGDRTPGRDDLEMPGTPNLWPEPVGAPEVLSPSEPPVALNSVPSERPPLPPPPEDPPHVEHPPAENSDAPPQSDAQANIDAEQQKRSAPR
jgi:hypothetical protein